MTRLSPASGEMALIRLRGPGPVAAGVLFSNFGPGRTFNVFDYFPIVGQAQPYYASEAVQFVPTVTAPFWDARVPLLLFSGPNWVTVSLAADSSGLPGALIVSLDLAGAMTGPHSPSIVTATPAYHPMLTAGTPYWLVVSTPTPGTNAGWAWNPPTVNDSASPTNFARSPFPETFGPWYLQTFVERPAFEIDGPPIVALP